MTTLIDVYTHLLRTADLTVTSDHLVSGKLVNQTRPVFVKGKRLALPSPEHLANPDKSQIVIFHPLFEAAGRGESEILEQYRSHLALRFNSVAGLLMAELLTMAMSTERHATLSPDQSVFLSRVKHADEKTYALFQKILSVMPSDQTARRVLTLYLKKSGTVAGRSHKRVGVVSFPLYQELKKEGHDIWGIKCRVKDKETLANLLEFIFPRIADEGAYHRGSDSVIAPNLDALMQASLAVLQDLNAVTRTFENQMGDEENPAVDMLIEHDWQETFANLGVMLNEIRRVPPQAGNEGASGEAPRPEAQNQVDAPASSAQPGLAPAPLEPACKPGLHAPAAATFVTPVIPVADASAPAPVQPAASPEPPSTPRAAPSPTWAQYPPPAAASHGGFGFDPAMPPAHTNPGFGFEPATYWGGRYPVAQPHPPTESRWAQQVSHQSMYPQPHGNFAHYPSGRQRLV